MYPYKPYSKAIISQCWSDVPKIWDASGGQGYTRKVGSYKNKVQTKDNKQQKFIVLQDRRITTITIKLIQDS